MKTNQLLIDTILPRPRKMIMRAILDIMLIFAFSIFTALCAKIKFEIGPVPITGQTFSVLLNGILLGSIRGSLSQVFYLIFGLLGLPLFARGGGMQYLVSPTFGYIIGFIFAAFMVGRLTENGWGKSSKSIFLAMIFGNVLIYVFGLLGLTRFIPSADILSVGLYPFIIGDIIKIIIIGLIYPPCWKFLQKLKVGSYQS